MVQELPASQRPTWVTVWDLALLQSIDKHGLPASDEDWLAIIHDGSLGFGKELADGRHHFAFAAQPLRERSLPARSPAAEPGQQLQHNGSSTAGASHSSPAEQSRHTDAEVQPASNGLAATPDVLATKRARSEPALSPQEGLPAKQRKAGAAPVHQCQLQAASPQHAVGGGTAAQQHDACGLAQVHNANAGALAVADAAHRESATEGQHGSPASQAVMGIGVQSPVRAAAAAPPVQQPPDPAAQPAAMQLAPRVPDALMFMARSRWALLRTHLAADVAEWPPGAIKLAGAPCRTAQAEADCIATSTRAGAPGSACPTHAQALAAACGPRCTLSNTYASDVATALGQRQKGTFTAISVHECILLAALMQVARLTQAPCCHAL